ncbi:TIGR03899 family protein [Alteromonas sp. ASW11-130]|uniref:TIGR03899 family protein n=1 Tax=Alteromonas sp. ASW11-130 TaxID=3015775 RepID=UPI0022428B7E|nr:TIGR03899 family protein [Alteromonas sp. ASW11-130]MCW8092697.1 TIGR03899 family protein [Alteromonas sp. ASW11-130]
MKIISSPHSSPINQVTTEKIDKNVEKASKQQDSVVSSSNGVRDKMRGMFAKVGIMPGMAMHDAKNRKIVVDRRRDIIASNKIANLQSILDVALTTSVPEFESETLDPDWFFAFTHLAENIYSSTMQELWGRIFAAEMAKPGSFSLRSLETLKALTQRDARLFSRAVSIASIRSGDPVPRILVGYHQRRGLSTLLRKVHPHQLNLSTYGLSYPDLLALDDMKLVYATEIESGELLPGKPVRWRCGTHSFSLTANRKGVALVYYKFTAVGAELATLITRQEPSHYLSAIKQLLKPHFTVT